MSYFYCDDCQDVFSIPEDYEFDALCLLCGEESCVEIDQYDFIKLESSQWDTELSRCECEDYPCCIHGG